MAYLMFKMLSSMKKTQSSKHCFLVYSDGLLQGIFPARGHELDSWSGEFLCLRVCMCVCERGKWGGGGTRSMCQIGMGGQMGRSRQEKVLGTEWRMILDKRLDGWLNKQWLQTIWWITMALWWTTHGLRGKQTGCVAGAWSAELLSQQYLDKDGVAIRVNMPFVWPYGQIVVSFEVF